MKYEHKTGVITLYSNRDHMLVKKRYATTTNRKLIIEQWRAFYQDRFNNYYYHISPDLVTVRQKELV